MISVQIPQFAAHSLQNRYYSMSDPSLPQAMSPYHKMSSHDQYSSGSESRQKASTPGAKRRPSRAGTRSVSTLTAAQLERKRANDREAQRAIRQRTKDHIDQLERRIAELSATNDTSAKLMQALQRNEELEQENAILRSRLNHTIAAMSEAGMSSEGVVLPPGPTSPSRRMKIPNQIRTSSTPAPRSIPTPIVQQGPMVSQDSWHSAYSPSSTVERSPALADTSPAPASMRWGPHHSQVSPSIPESERSMHSVEAAVQQQQQQQQHPVSYGYVLDPNGRPMQYQSEGQLMPSYPPATSPGAHAHMNEYHTRHSGAQMASQMASAPAPTYAQYPPQPSVYMPTSSHEAESMPMMHRPVMESQQIMYSMPSNNMKAEQ